MIKKLLITCAALLTLALQSGAVMDPEGKCIGTFQSIWRLEADGRWRIIFDRGCPACDCGSKQE